MKDGEGLRGTEDFWFSLCLELQPTRTEMVGAAGLDRLQSGGWGEETRTAF